MIEMQGITFNYPDGTEVLKNFDFKFEKGDRLGLVGPNGTGKSTIFKIIMGLLKPQAGELKIFNTRREEKGDFHEVRERIGFLFQDADDQLFCPTVEEDIAFGPLNLGKSKTEALQIVDRTLILVGMEEFKKRVTYHLSGGEKKIISFAAVLAMEPDMLLLDEPFAGLDQKTVAKVIDILENIPQSYIIVSHNNDLLEKVTNRYFDLN